MTRVSLNHATKTDIRAVLTIKDLKIGIESQGNSKGRLHKESLDFFVRIAVTSSSAQRQLRAATVDAVKALAGFDVQWLEQHEQSQVNEQILRDIVTARQIVEKVDLLIESAEPTFARTLSATA